MWSPPTRHHSLSVLLYPLFCLHPEPGCQLQSRKSADGKSHQLSQASTHLSRLGLGALALIPDSASSQRSSRTLAVIVAFIIIEIGSLHVKSGQQCNTHSPYLLERVPMRAKGLKHTLSWLPGRGVTGEPMLSPRSPSPASTLHAGREIGCQLSADTTEQDRRAWISTPSRHLRCFCLRPRCQNHGVTLRD